MDNHHEHEHSFEEVATMLIAAYVLIGKLLTRLPLPIAIPAVTNGELDGRVAIAALDKARTAMRDLPMDDTVKSLLDRLLMEWLIAHELGVIETFVGHECWRLEAMTYVLNRIMVIADLAELGLESHE